MAVDFFKETVDNGLEIIIVILYTICMSGDFSNDILYVILIALSKIKQA